MTAVFYSTTPFFDAWARGVMLAGEQFFGDGTSGQLEKARSKHDLAPRYDDVVAALGYLSSGEAAFIVALYSFYNDETAAKMWKKARVNPLAGLAAVIDEPRRRVIADLLVAYEGW